MTLPGPPAPPAPRRDGWKRVHPLSPWVRGWILLLALFLGVGRDWVQSILTGEPMRGWWSGVPVPVLGWVGSAVVLAVGGAFVLSWWTTRYRIDESMVQVTSGIIFRQHRQARLDRVQAVDVVQPFLARLLGLAELRFEVADAHESALRLAFLPVAEAQQLRAGVLAAAAAAGSPAAGPPSAAVPVGVPADAAGTPPRLAGAPSPAGANEALVVEVPVARIIASTALTPLVIGAAVVSVAGVLLEVTLGVRAVGAAFIPAVLGAAITVWNRINRGWNFRVMASGEGLRVSHGLLETRAETVPAGRMQAILIHQPLLWRPFGWWSVHVNIAGHRRASEREGSKSTILPAGTVNDVFRVLGPVLPDPGTAPGTGRAVVEAGLVGAGDAWGFAHSPRSARWVDPLAWRRTGFLATDTALLCRTGVLARRLVIVPHERTQSIALTQGPLERRLGLARIELHSTPGPVRPAVPHLSVAVAEALFSEQAARAAAARRRRPAPTRPAPPAFPAPPAPLPPAPLPPRSAPGGTA